MDGHLAHTTSGFAAAAGLWFAMTVAMMAPVVTPWVRAYATLVAPGRAPGESPAWAGAFPFIAGYALVWTAFAVAMAALQQALVAAGALVGGRVDGVAGAALLVGAGAFQFAPLKQACLTHCRNPLSYFLARWRDGAASGLRLGLGHGLFCLGCCWALMATALAMGAMNLWWMALLTLVAIVEQWTPLGLLASRGVGLALVGLGVWRLL